MCRFQQYDLLKDQILHALFKDQIAVSWARILAIHVNVLAITRKLKNK